MTKKHPPVCLLESLESLENLTKSLYDEFRVKTQQNTWLYHFPWTLALVQAAHIFRWSMGRWGVYFSLGARPMKRSEGVAFEGMQVKQVAVMPAKCVWPCGPVTHRFLMLMSADINLNTLSNACHQNPKFQHKHTHTVSTQEGFGHLVHVWLREC